MRWAGHVARLGEERKVYRLWWESSKERAHLEDQGVDGIRMDLNEIGCGV
jgi:alpha-glucosidase (family GH31 glycosyl hydrolase)